MGQAITITNLEHSAADLRRLASRERDGEVARRFSVETTERTIGRWLRRLKLARLQPRPFHPKKDADAQEASKTYGPPRLQVVF